MYGDDRGTMKTELLRVEAERDALKAEVERLTRGGCGKPGHTTASSEEGTCWCLTCQLQAEVAELKWLAEGMAEAIRTLNKAIPPLWLSDCQEALAAYRAAYPEEASR